jgi:TonB family protein
MKTMNTRAFLLTAAALLFGASATHATPSESQRYADRAKAKADSLLHASRLDLGGQSVSVRAKVDIDGRVIGMDVVRSSGSRDADLAAETILRRVVASDPPMGLSDGAVLMTVSSAPVA